MKKVLIVLLAVLLVFSFSLSACKSADDGDAKADPENTGPEPVTIHLFSNLPDRETGQGLVEQMLVDQYMAENDYVTIEVEALQDEPYKTKFKAYSSGNDMPDVVSAWGQPSFLYEVIDAGLLQELNPSDYDAYGFIPGSLDGFTKDGKLYGLPRNTDIMGFFYNKKIFSDNGWDVPTTYSEFLALAKKMQDKKINTCITNGADKWSLAIYITDLLAKLEGSFGNEVQTAVDNSDFSNPAFEKAASLMQDAQKAGLFAKGFETADYGAAKNMFINGQAAMFYMGSWEMGMAADDSIDAEVRDNIGVFTMPLPDGANGVDTDIAAWNGGGYAVSSSSQIKEEALKFLNWMFLPENWNKLTWQNNVCMSAQDFSAYATGEETAVQQQFTDMVANATSISGTTINDRGDSSFKTLCENTTQKLAIGKITPKEFVKQLGGK